MNNVVNIIDRQFNFLAQIDDYESLILNKSYSGVGTFALHVNENTNNADKLLKENIIFTTPKKAYIILHREIDSVDGKLVVKGLELKSYLSRLITYPPEGQAYHRINNNVETIMKEYVTNQLALRGITNIVVNPNLNRGITTVFQTRYKNLADELEKLSILSGLGWDVTLDLENKKFIFDIVEGKDKSINQSILPPAIFSIEYDNIAEQKLIDSKLNYANIAVVAGQGEGADRAISIVGNADGLDRFELFVDARDLENNDYLPARGEQKLSELKEILTFDSQVLTDKNLRYEEDFNLGDISTIINKKWNVSVDRRITELTEVYEGTGFRLDIVFGEDLPTVKDLIKQATDAPIVEGGGSSEPGEPGTDGADGLGLQFTWDGTKLGVKREDEANYQYTDLEGKQGPEGPQGLPGLPGLNGKSLEFHWNSTQLGVRIEGQPLYQYVNLQGIQGPEGPPGNDGTNGVNGKSLQFHWNGTELGVRLEGETNYQYVNLKGNEGPEGPPGIGIPVGGLAGQVLSKVDNTDYNTQWVDNSGGIDNFNNITISSDDSILDNLTLSEIANQTGRTVKILDNKGNEIFYVRPATPIYGNGIVGINGNGLTNTPLLSLNNNGEGVSGIALGYWSGGSLGVGYLSGATVSIGTTNRNMLFDVNNEAYDGGSSPSAFMFRWQSQSPSKAGVIFKGQANQPNDYLRITDNTDNIKMRVDKDGFIDAKGFKKDGVELVIPTKTSDLENDSGFLTELPTTISVPTNTGLFKVGIYGTISETNGGLAYITGNNIASAGDNIVAKTISSADAAQFIRMRYDAGISIHTGVEGNVGEPQSDDVNERFRIDNDGNVGIGTLPNLAYKVDIDGVVNATGYKINGKDLENVGGGGTKIITSATEPEGLVAGDQWHREY